MRIKHLAPLAVLFVGLTAFAACEDNDIDDADDIEEVTEEMGEDMEEAGEEMADDMEEMDIDAEVHDDTARLEVD